ncbi:hypothetical protein OHS70_35950 [Streptomyces sp. NBC_00390]|uniref:hypothetical protein n=1 Tax=Streptomyces sp. NBC_00390 TaxID=2975736 RepID=UPI002E216D92
MKRPRQHGKPHLSAHEEVTREIRDAEPDVVERRRAESVSGGLTVGGTAQENTRTGDTEGR